MKTSIVILSVAASVCVNAQWDYSQQGSNWTEGTCDSGKKQSPITVMANITAEAPYNATLALIGIYDTYKVAQTGHDITITPSLSDGDVTHHSLLIEETAGGTETIKVHDLLSYHFHAGSEHAVDTDTGKADLEAQFYFQNTEDVTVHTMMSFLFTSTPTDANDLPGMKALSELDLSATGSSDQTTGSLDMLATFLNLANGTLSSSLFTYDGSLTMPPCTEKVRWFVWTTPLKLETAVYSKLAAELKYVATGAGAGTPKYENYREVQPLEATNVVLKTYGHSLAEVLGGSTLPSMTISLLAVVLSCLFYM